MGSGEMK